MGILTSVLHGRENMLILIMALTSIFWFCNSTFFIEWSNIMVGGEQISVSVTALVIFFYLAFAAFGVIQWYYRRRF